MRTKPKTAADPIMLMTVAAKNRCSAGLNERKPGVDTVAHARASSWSIPGGYRALEWVDAVRIRARRPFGRSHYGDAVDVHLAQINIGTMLAATDDPIVAEFMDGLERVNAIAD